MDSRAANVAYVYELNNGGIPAAGISNPNVSLASSSLGAAAQVAAGPPPGVMNVAANAVAAGMDGLPPPPSVAQNTNYCLRWNEYEKKYAETFRVMRDEEDFTDVTLATEGHSVKAHRVILSACSNYFHAILKSISPWQHPVLLLQDVSSSDLNSLMDFIYFGQASVSHDSFQSFLRVAEKLKIKGLCESLAPPPPLPLPVTTISPPNPVNSHVPPPPSLSAPPRKDMTMPQTPPILHTSVGSAMPQVPVSNFEGLLPRSPYIPEQAAVPLSSQAPIGVSSVVGRSVGAPSAPPVAHQSPRQSSRPANLPAPPPPRPSVIESHMHYASPKRAKYTLSPQSILRNQLQLKESEHVEVKSEPMAILSSSSSQEEVPSSGVNVTEFISSHDSDLALQSLGHGISPQFMFSPDPADNGQGHPGASGANGPPPPTATLVTMDDGKTTVQGGNMINIQTSMSSLAPQQHSSASVVTTHHLHQHLQPPQQQPPSHPGAASTPHHHRHDEPQDLTPGPQDSPVGIPTHTPPANHGSSSSSLPPPVTPTSANNSSSSATASPSPPKKDRNSRKTCGYCHKDFHEMSLKRHIKDVHFRSQNTYVICPQCCKQYASQNSLYSHLNRVHGVKKDMMPTDLQLHIGNAGQAGGAAAAQQASANAANAAAAAAAANAANNAAGNSTPTPVDNHHQPHDGIMDLAHHSDNSN